MELLSGADVWSLGITLFAMVTGRLPWSRACLSDPEYARYVHQYVQNEKDTVGSTSVPSEDFWPSELSLELRSLLSAVLHPDWRQRVDLETMKNHPWIVSNVLNEGYSSTGDVTDEELDKYESTLEPMECSYKSVTDRCSHQDEIISIGSTLCGEFFDPQFDLEGNYEISENIMGMMTHNDCQPIYNIKMNAIKRKFVSDDTTLMRSPNNLKLEPGCVETIKRLRIE